MKANTGLGYLGWLSRCDNGLADNTGIRNILGSKRIQYKHQSQTFSKWLGEGDDYKRLVQALRFQRAIDEVLKERRVFKVNVSLIVALRAYLCASLR